MNRKVFVTGCAGFIGFHLTSRLLDEGFSVVGIDNLNDYYDVQLKKDRLDILINKRNMDFTFHRISLEDDNAINKLFADSDINVVINLAAQAGVRYSLQNPKAYINSNLVGFINILEACRHNNVEHLIYASSSSVYGGNEKVPFSVHDNVDHPVSLYAATKKSNELMAHSYSHLFGLPTTGLRFFTVYGPWGRPDMALFLFTKAIIEGNPIKVFNNGKMLRDFTFIDDIIEGIIRLIPKPPISNECWDRSNPDPGTSFAPYRVFNIGNNNPVQLTKFIETIENKLGKKASKEYLPIQNGDVPATYADVSDLMDVVGFKPDTSIDDGIERFINWYKKYYNVSI